MRFLDYLIEYPAQAVLIAGSGILVNVPDPARFVLHKLAAKDLRQAGDLLEVLLEDRPGDLLVAWDALGRHPAQQQAVVEEMRRLRPEVREKLESQVSRSSP